MKQSIAVSLCALAFAAARPALSQQNAAAIIGRSARVYRSLSSLKADFVQIIDNPMIDSAESRGTLVQSGQAKLAMRFSDPPSEAVVIDGAHVWLYTPSSTPGQVLRMSVPTGGPVYGFNLLAWFLDRPAERYKASYVRADRLAGQAVDVVRLEPIVPDLPFTQATLWLARDDGLPRRLEIEERSGATRTLTLANVRVNQTIAEKTFRFDVPAGVRVIDQ